MPTYTAPVDEVLFLLNDVFQIDRYNNLPGFADASPDLIEAILGEAAKFCQEVLTPLNRIGDIEGCTRHDDGSVTTPSGFKDAYRQFAEGGWIGLSAPEAFGGQGLPEHADRHPQRVHDLGQHGFHDVSGAHARRDRGTADARLTRTAAKVPA